MLKIQGMIAFIIFLVKFIDTLAPTAITFNVRVSAGYSSHLGSSQ